MWSCAHRSKGCLLLRETRRNPAIAEQVAGYIISQAELLANYSLMGRIAKPGAPRELVFYPPSLQPHLQSHQHQDQGCQGHPPVAPISIGTGGIHISRFILL